VHKREFVLTGVDHAQSRIWLQSLYVFFSRFPVTINYARPDMVNWICYVLLLYVQTACRTHHCSSMIKARLTMRHVSTPILNVILFITQQSHILLTACHCNIPYNRDVWIYSSKANYMLEKSFSIHANRPLSMQASKANTLLKYIDHLSHSRCLELKLLGALNPTYSLHFSLLVTHVYLDRQIDLYNI
jgi:hypothetical protein